MKLSKLIITTQRQIVKNFVSRNNRIKKAEEELKKLKIPKVIAQNRANIYPFSAYLFKKKSTLSGYDKMPLVPNLIKVC